MTTGHLDETRDFWNRIAADWRIQVGDDGDLNRRLNSDPVLWAMAGDVRGRDVLDAGCGTGYLAGQLARQGARVIGADFSERMIAIARSTHPTLDFRVDSCTELATVGDATVDLVVSNYVLMDTPDLAGTIRAFHRVLRPGGHAVVIFSHPCFPQGRSDSGPGPLDVSYRWSWSYFDSVKMVDPPWHHFTSEFIWFHRPLSTYWKAFRGAGFAVVDMEEPRIAPERYHLADSPKRLENSKSRPYSIAFKLHRPTDEEKR